MVVHARCRSLSHARRRWCRGHSDPGPQE